MGTMLKARTLGLCTAVFAALFTAGAVQAASPKPIKLKLKGTYTVVALSKSGEVSSVSGSGSLKLVPPARVSTVHILSSNGDYLGPVIVGKRGKAKVVTGVKDGTNLGSLKVLSGYATASVSKSKTVASMTAKASKAGVPIGAKKIGLVKSKASGRSGDGVDQDNDGIPGAFDVDDDGDLIMDNFESQSSIRATALQEPPVEGAPSEEQAPAEGSDPAQAAPNFTVFSNFKLGIEDTLNANAPGISDALIDQLMVSTQSLAISVPTGNQALLDCNGLSYCSLGGTGHVGTTAFPDPTNNVGGLGVLTAGPTGDLQLLTGATSSQIGSGNTMTATVTTAGVTTQIPAMLNFVFITTPALTSWSDGTNTGSISYPATGGPGTPSNPIPVTPNASGQGEVSLTFWRPQRRGIPAAGEATLMDIGNLTYTADIPNGAFTGSTGSSVSGPGNCNVSSYSTSDPNLQVGSDGVDDQAADQAANGANTLTFTVNLSTCFTSAGMSISSGETVGVDIQARSTGGDNAAQKVYFTLQ